jgi:hypothetical protein
MFSGCLKASKSGLRAAIFLFHHLASKPLRRDVLRAAGEILPAGRIGLGQAIMR